MKFGFVFPRADILKAIEFAKAAERANWDAFFVWEPTYGIDAWVTLAAIATQTEKIRLGTLLSPISRMRPWKIASETLTLDILSNGRINLCIGLGAIDTGFEVFGEETERKKRTELLDEGLDIMNKLWSREFSDYQGKHYQMDGFKECVFFKRHPPPKLIQNPRIPIWVVGAWPRKKSMQRALYYDGIIPTIKTKQGKFEEITPKHIREIKTYIENHRQSISLFDIIVEGQTPGDKPEVASTIVKPFAKAGATWWIESIWTSTDINHLLNRVKQGPPILEQS